MKTIEVIREGLDKQQGLTATCCTGSMRKISG